MDFSVGFQLRLLLLFYLDKEFYGVSKDLVKGEFFNSIFCQWLFKFLEIYVELYKALPTKLVVEEELRSNRDFIELPEEQGLVNEFLSLLQLANKAELQYVKDTFLKFAKAKSLNVWRSEQEESFAGGDFDNLFSSLKTESRKFDLPNQNRDKDLFSLRNLKELYEDHGGIKSGISLVDNVVGGLGTKQLSVVLADLNVGKSLYLTHIGGAAVRQHKHVTHVTLEMSFAHTLARYLANLGEEEDDITYNEIVNLEDSDMDKVIKYVHDSLHEKYEGLLQIEEFPTGKCSVQNLYNILDKYPETELLIVDYLGIMKPTVRRKELRFELSETAIGLRGIASEAKIHVATATQANRTANNKRIIDTSKTAEDIGIQRVADFSVGMGQTQDDVIKQEVVMFLARSRNSGKFTAERYAIDFKRMRFRLMKQEVLTG